MLANTIVYGFVNSVILVLVALGFNLTFGISGIANFAYGALYILGALLSWVFFNTIGLYIGFIGFEYSLPVFIDTSIEIGQVVVDMQRIFIVLIGTAMAGFLWFFTHHTRTGLRFRGIAQEERTALSLGINTDRVAMLSVSFGAAYAAIAAIVILPLGTINIEQGYSVLINALAVCIVGGLGSTGGLVLASFLIGYGQTITVTYIESHWVMLVPLIAILGILIFRPSGLFGEHKELEERI
jgi:branched-chain amino acid transport system permease protein